MATSIISAGDAANLGVQTTGGDDGVLVLRSGAAGAKVDALSIAAVGTGAFVGEVTATGFTGTLDGVLGGGTPAAATVTTLAASGDLSANNFAGRNKIINGAMVIDQRNAGASVTGNNSVFSVDRWKVGATQTSKFTMQQVTDAPAGFKNSLKITSSSAYSVTSADEFEMFHTIEGNNVADLNWGTANAASVTLSFQTKSSLAGTFGGVLYNSATNRSYIFSYTINSANTWESKSVTIAGDTTGTWETGTAVGISVLFCIGAGSTLLSTAGSWSSTFYRGPTGQVSVVGTNAATWQITGVQLEKSSTATEFDYRSVGTELALCQRYFSKSFAQGTAPVNQSYYAAGFSDVTIGSNISTTASVGVINYPIIMRAAPTIAFYSAQGGGNDDGKWSTYDGVDHVDGTAVASAYDNKFKVVVTVASGLTSGNGTLVLGNWTASAEL